MQKSKLTRFKISATLRNSNRVNPPIPNPDSRKPKPIYKASLDGTKLEEYSSINEAAKKNGIARKSIFDNLKGKTKTCSGHTFHYINK